MPFFRPLFFAAAFALALHSSTALAATPRHPNILIILADDMGFSDLGCYGSEIQTPNLDRLASEGLRFSQFYNCALCGPSRASLMTGLHPHQAGVTAWTGLLNNRCVTLFEVLKSAGYSTAAVGRLDMVTSENWHEPQNIARHVDRFLGSTGHKGPGNYFKDVRNSDFYRDTQPYSLPEGAYKTDLITDFAVAFLKQRDASKPFLLYMAHYAPHWPLHAKPQDIAKYRDLYRKLGWDAARAQRLQKLINNGVLPSGTRLPPRDARATAWSEAKNLDWEAERMATYAAQIDCLDQSVGRVMETLRTTGADKNTLVFFLSDNGAADTSVSQLDKPGQPTWRSDGTPTRVGNKPDIQPGPAENFVTAGPAWSNVANTPFRQHKNSNHEGGIASPLIVWWPGVIAKPGSVCTEMCHITDIPTTCMKLAGGLDMQGGNYSVVSDKPNLPFLAGQPLLPLLEGGTAPIHSTLCWSTSGSKAVRQGNWKLVALPKQPWELYDLSQDRTELNDLSEQEPDRVQSMEKIFKAWQERSR
jgi:arylsulfatase A-like enzyme